MKTALILTFLGLVAITQARLAPKKLVQTSLAQRLEYLAQLERAVVDLPVHTCQDVECS